MLLQHWYFTR